jgi:hypothetical protein
MKRIVAWVLSLILIGVIIILAIVSFSLFNTSNINVRDVSVGIIKDLSDNWSSNPIMSIISTDSIGCPAGYSYFINNNWGGTKPGCYCGNSFMFTGSCMETGNQHSNICTDVKGIESTKYHTWDTKRICVKRLDTDYFSMKLASGSCPTDFPQQCGIIDTLGTKLCLKSTDVCPINDLRIIPIADKYISPLAYTEINLGSKKIVYTNQNIGGNIPVQFVISENTPCADPTYQNHINGYSYFLDNYYSKETCSVLVNGNREDSNFVKVDSDILETVLYNNGILNFYGNFQKYSYFPKDRFKYQTNLYSRPFTGMKNTCMKDFASLSSLIKDIDSIDNSYQNFPKIMIPSGIIFLVQLIILIIWVCVNIFHKISGFDDTESHFSKFIQIVSVSAIVISIAGLIVGFDTNATAKKINIDTLQKISNCSDANTKALLDNILNTFNTVLTNEVTAAVLLIVNIILIIGEWVIWHSWTTLFEPEKKKGDPLDQDETNVSKNDNMLVVEEQSKKASAQKDDTTEKKVDSNKGSNKKLSNLIFKDEKEVEMKNKEVN